MFFIDQHEISNTGLPFIIAEIGSNFDQSMEKAKHLIDGAANAGAQAVKFQMFNANEMFPEKKGPYQLMKSIELKRDWSQALKAYAEERNCIFAASPFDLHAVDTLQKIDVSFYKIASSELINFPLIHKIAKTGKPAVISTGMSEMSDVFEAVSIFEELGNRKIALLQCGADYPLAESDANLKVIKKYQDIFNLPVGFSDHTLGNVAAQTAVGVGARVFEKHITYDKSAKGPDHSYALEIEEFKSYVDGINRAFISLGEENKKYLEIERDARRRKSIYLIENVKKGDPIQEQFLEVRGPYSGIKPCYLKDLIGATADVDMVSGECISWEKISFNGKS
jgi:sialic acid synthase SpsE